MSRKILLTLVLFCLLISAKGQNLQLHFDPRSSLYGDDVSGINYLTATFEFFKPDQWGNTFMFVDFDFSFDKRNPGLIYGEIAREFKIGDFPLLPHIEYNGGLGLVRGEDFGFSIPSSYLAGFGYPFQLGNFFMSTYLAYKLNAFEQVSNDAQWTVTWNALLANNKISLGGFMDLWTEDKSFTEGTETNGKKLILLSEPQIWFNITPNFSLGSEVELSYNFVNKFAESKFYAIPTLATKWIF
jgi:hypothetical protein